MLSWPVLRLLCGIDLPPFLQQLPLRLSALLCLLLLPLQLIPDALEIVPFAHFFLVQIVPVLLQTSQLLVQSIYAVLDSPGLGKIYLSFQDLLGLFLQEPLQAGGHSSQLPVHPGIIRLELFSLLAVAVQILLQLAQAVLQLTQLLLQLPQLLFALLAFPGCSMQLKMLLSALQILQIAGALHNKLALSFQPGDLLLQPGLLWEAGCILQGRPHAQQLPALLDPFPVPAPLGLQPVQLALQLLLLLA